MEALFSDIGISVDEYENDADVAERVSDGLDIVQAFCCISDPALRRAIKRVVVELCGKDRKLPAKL